jgi:glutamyl-tRNA reductase
VVLHDIDQLEATLDQNLSLRSAAVPNVEDIVADETQIVMDWLKGRDAKQVVADLREQARVVAEDELRAALRKLGPIDQNSQEIISRMTHRIVTKLLHQPTKQLKSRASCEDFAAYCDAIADLFGLNGHSAPQPEKVAGESRGR